MDIQRIASLEPIIAIIDAHKSEGLPLAVAEVSMTWRYLRSACNGHVVHVGLSSSKHIQHIWTTSIFIRGVMAYIFPQCDRKKNVCCTIQVPLSVGFVNVFHKPLQANPKKLCIVISCKNEHMAQIISLSFSSVILTKFVADRKVTLQLSQIHGVKGKKRSLIPCLNLQRYFSQYSDDWPFGNRMVSVCGHNWRLAFPPEHIKDNA